MNQASVSLFFQVRLFLKGWSRLTGNKMNYNYCNLRNLNSKCFAQHTRLKIGKIA